MKILMILLALLVCETPLSSYQDQDQDRKTISAFIVKQARHERGEEYEDARKIVAGDLNGDGVPETVVLYTIESQSGSNNYIQYLAVFTRRGDHLVAITHTPVGGKSRRSVELDSVDRQQVNLTTMSYAPTDGSCCPSIKGTTTYLLVRQTLRERKPKRGGS